MRFRLPEGSLDLAVACALQWLAQLALVTYLTQALIARTDLPTYATLATHESHSLKKMMTASCTFIIYAESCQIATCVDSLLFRWDMSIL